MRNTGRVWSTYAGNEAPPPCRKGWIIILSFPEQYMTVLKINGTFTCSTPLTLAPTNPVRNSVRLDQTRTMWSTLDRNPRHPSALFLQPLRMAIARHPTLTRSVGWIQRLKKTKLNSFSPPNHLNGDQSPLNDHAPPTRNPHRLLLPGPH